MRGTISSAVIGLAEEPRSLLRGSGGGGGAEEAVAVVMAAADGQLAAWFGIKDKLKDGVEDVVNGLHSKGILVCT